MVDRPPLHKQGYTRGGVAVLPLPVPKDGAVPQHSVPRVPGQTARAPTAPPYLPPASEQPPISARTSPTARPRSLPCNGFGRLPVCRPPPVSTPCVNLSTCCVNVGASMGGSYQLA